MTSSNRKRWLLALLYPLTFSALASSLLRACGFPLDDSYIYQTVAREVATGRPGFRPGHAPAGATSMLWLYIQAANYKFLHAFDPVLYNAVIGCVLLAIIGQLLFTMVKRDGLPNGLALLVAASPALCGNLLWLGLIGMEHLLFIALSLGSIVLWYDGASLRPRRTAVCTGIATGLLAITRPEAMALGPLLLLMHRRRRSHVVLALCGWAVGVAGFFTWSWRNFHSWMPPTFQGRSWLWFHKEGGPHTLEAIGSFIGQGLQRLPRLFLPHLAATHMRLTSGNRLFTLLALLLFALFLAGIYALLARRAPRVQALFLWTLVEFLAYLILLPAAGQGGRYQSLILLLAFPLILSGALWGIESLLPAAHSHAVLIGLALMVIAGACSLTTWRGVTIAGTEHIRNTHLRMAAWIAANLPPEARVATFDSGAISYQLHRPVTDLGGLVDPAILPYLKQGREDEYLKKNGVRYAVIPEQPGEDLGLLSPAARKSARQIVQFCSPFALWAQGYSYTEHAFRCQTLYALPE